MTDRRDTIDGLLAYLERPYAEEHRYQFTLRNQAWTLALRALIAERDALKAALVELREADDDIVNMEVTTKEAFDRLHEAERAADALLGRAKPQEPIP